MSSVHVNNISECNKTPKTKAVCQNVRQNFLLSSAKLHNVTKTNNTVVPNACNIIPALKCLDLIHVKICLCGNSGNEQANQNYQNKIIDNPSVVDCRILQKCIAVFLYNYSGVLQLPIIILPSTFFIFISESKIILYICACSFCLR